LRISKSVPSQNGTGFVSKGTRSVESDPALIFLQTNSEKSIALIRTGPVPIPQPVTAGTVKYLSPGVLDSGDLDFKIARSNTEFKHCHKQHTYTEHQHSFFSKLMIAEN
jgi:hypothetical protein